jgi:hypothetical protein
MEHHESLDATKNGDSISGPPRSIGVGERNFRRSMALSSVSLVEALSDVTIGAPSAFLSKDNSSSRDEFGESESSSNNKLTSSGSMQQSVRDNLSDDPVSPDANKTDGFISPTSSVRALGVYGLSPVPKQRNFPRAPIQTNLGNRTVSTQDRLRQQGFRERSSTAADDSVVGGSGVAQFAVRSIRRGSDDWRNLVKPFVSDLVFKSLFQPRSQAEIVFLPYTSHAAVVRTIALLCLFLLTRPVEHSSNNVWEILLS